MIDLVAKSPADGVLPVRIGSLSVEEVQLGSMHSIAPFKGAKVSAALKKAVGVGLPELGKSARNGEVEVLWAARGQYFLVGAHPPKLSAAVTDQSDAWCALALTGEGADQAMARLCPVDVAGVAEGDVLRSLVGHMSAIIIKRADGYQIIVFRAFAKTLVHELSEVATSLGAQAVLPN